MCTSGLHEKENSGPGPEQRGGLGQALRPRSGPSKTPLYACTGGVVVVDSGYMTTPRQREH